MIDLLFLRKTWSVPVFLPVFLLAVLPAQAATHYVGSCGTPNTTTIAAAITAAAAGDTILICPGTYTLASTIVVDKSGLTLASSTGNRADVTIQNHTTTVVSITAHDTTLRALTIYSNPQHAIHANGANNLWLDEVTSNSEWGNGLRLQDLDGTRLTNFRATAGHWDGAIRLVNAGNLTLDGTANAIGSRQWGITGDGGRPANLKATGLTISPASRNTPRPISLLNAGRVEVRNSTITAVYSGNGGTAMDLRQGTGHHVFDNLTVKADSYGHGIYLDGGDGATFTDTDIESTGDNPGPALHLVNQRGDVSFRAVNKPRVKLTAWSRVRHGYYEDAIRLAAAQPLTLTLDKVDLRAYHKGIWQTGSAVGTNFTDITVTAASEQGIRIDNGAGRAQVLRDVTVTSGAQGIFLNGSSNAQMSNLTIDAGGGWMNRGLHLVNPVSPVLTGMNNVIIRSGNGIGIYFKDCTSGGRASGATVDGLGAVDAWGGRNQGIVMENCSNAEVSGNTVKNTQGITISGGSHSASVYNNRVENSSIGIRLQADSGRAWDNCLFNTSNASASGSSEFYSRSPMQRGNYWGSWPVGTGYSVTCADGNGDGICDGRFSYQRGKWDEYPLKALPNCGSTPPTPPPVNPANFNCVESGANAATGRLYTKLAGATFAFDVVALKADGSVETQFAADANKDVTIELVDGSGTTACASRAAINPAISQTLTFAAANAGRKSASLTVAKAYPDLRCRVTDANQTPSIVGCSTDNFAVRPTGFTVTSSANADVAGASASATPAVKTGANFTLAAASGAVGYNAAPRLDASKVAAHGGAVQAGALAGSFDNANPATGTATGAAFTYSEVGYFNLAANGVYDDTFTAVDSAAGDCASGFADGGGKYACNFGNAAATPYFGRFIPDHFALNQGVATPACGGFTYFGQDGFGTSFTLMAQNSTNAVTQNYAGNFARLGLTTWSNFVFTSGSLPAGSAFGASATAPTGSWSNGVAAVTAKHQASRPTALAGETGVVVKAAPVDPDGVTMAAAPVVAAAAGTPLRYGRLRLLNFHGSELLPARVEYRAEYWDGSRWTTNALDTCSMVAAGNIAPGGLTVSATRPPTYASGVGFVTFDTAAVAGYDIAINLNASGSDTSCNANHGGTAANRPWLQGSWGAPARCNGTAAWAQDPNARIRLGSPKAPYIYLRERY